MHTSYIVMRFCAASLDRQTGLCLALPLHLPSRRNAEFT